MTKSRKKKLLKRKETQIYQGKSFFYFLFSNITSIFATKILSDLIGPYEILKNVVTLSSLSTTSNMDRHFSNENINTGVSVVFKTKRE